MAFNEEERIGKTILRIPRQIPGVDSVEILVINDGSTDNTIDIAMNAGADKIISHKTNLGVGAAFTTGVRNALSMKADIVVTVDADGEPNIEQIPDLINPILNNQFDVVVGTRFWKDNSNKFKKINNFGNRIFTNLVSFVAGRKFTDTQTGFRSYSKEALENVTVVSDFTYTQEVLLDLHFKKFRIGETPITFKLREDSRLVKSISKYAIRGISIIVSSLVFHRPIMAFGLFGLFLSGLGITAKIFTSVLNIIEINATLSSGLILLGGVSFMMGLFAHIVFKRQTYNQKDLLSRIRKLEDSENS